MKISRCGPPVGCQPHALEIAGSTPAPAIAGVAGVPSIVGGNKVNTVQCRCKVREDSRPVQCDDGPTYAGVNPRPIFEHQGSSVLPTKDVCNSGVTIAPLFFGGLQEEEK
jgi:hypothetical protein